MPSRSRLRKLKQYAAVEFAFHDTMQEMAAAATTLLSSSSLKQQQYPNRQEMETSGNVSPRRGSATSLTQSTCTGHSLDASKFIHSCRGARPHAQASTFHRANPTSSGALTMPAPSLDTTNHHTAHSRLDLNLHNYASVDADAPRMDVNVCCLQDTTPAPPPTNTTPKRRRRRASAIAAPRKSKRAPKKAVTLPIESNPTTVVETNAATLANSIASRLDEEGCARLRAALTPDQLHVLVSHVIDEKWGDLKAYVVLKGLVDIYYKEGQCEYAARKRLARRVLQLMGPAMLSELLETYARGELRRYVSDAEEDVQIALDIIDQFVPNDMGIGEVLADAVNLVMEKPAVAGSGSDRVWSKILHKVHTMTLLTMVYPHAVSTAMGELRNQRPSPPMQSSLQEEVVDLLLLSDLDKHYQVNNGAAMAVDVVFEAETCAPSTSSCSSSTTSMMQVDDDSSNYAPSMNTESSTEECVDDDDDDDDDNGGDMLTSNMAGAVGDDDFIDAAAMLLEMKALYREGVATSFTFVS